MLMSISGGRSHREPSVLQWSSSASLRSLIRKVSWGIQVMRRSPRQSETNSLCNKKFRMFATPCTLWCHPQHFPAEQVRFQVRFMRDLHWSSEATLVTADFNWFGLTTHQQTKVTEDLELSVRSQEAGCASFLFFCCVR